jgi:hypothetical protein
MWRFHICKALSLLRQEMMIRHSIMNLDTSVDPDWLSGLSLSTGAGVYKPAGPQHGSNH